MRSVPGEMPGHTADMARRAMPLADGPARNADAAQKAGKALLYHRQRRPELIASRMRIVIRRVSCWHGAVRSPGPACLDVITPKCRLPGSWSIGWPLGRPDGRPASNVGQRRRADDNVGRQLKAETPLDGGLISRYRGPPAGNPGRPVQGCPVARCRPPGPWRQHPCAASPTERLNKTQLLLVLVDVNDIETSDPPRHSAARRHLRGSGRKALSAVVLSGVALVIFGGLTLKTLLVIAAAGAIVAAARRYRPKK
jgi:hypothetical protein